MKKQNKEPKQIVLILSSQFMKSHPRAGEQTNFENKIIMGLQGYNNSKLHTIRADYDGWVKKVAVVNSGEAVLRVVTWDGVPYKSKWVDVATLTNKDNIGVQKIQFDTRDISVFPAIVTRADNSIAQIDPPYIAKNDGLSMTDMVAWFAEYDLSKPLAIIHFTKFRY